MKIVSVVGARPQFIKAAPVSRAIRAGGHREFLLHTGQHYDYGMTDVFFEELEIPEPDVNLAVGSGSHGWQTAEILKGVEEVLTAQRPDHVLVYGDTNSTLAAALAACKLRLPLAHVEAGLRSHNRDMPEEHNRVLTDHCSDLLFCPTETAVANLRGEGIVEGVHRVGDTMRDAVDAFSEIAGQRSSILGDLGLAPGGYLLATVHRPYNTDRPDVLSGILRAFGELGENVVFPVHPRTRARIDDLPAASASVGATRLIDPVGYLDMLQLERNARLILTDSGGMQKEAYFFGVPCLTLRPETEWTETVEAGWNRVVGSDPASIVEAVAAAAPGAGPRDAFGDGDAAGRIVAVLGQTARA